MAERFGVFDRAVGSDGATNNKGSAKAAFLQKVAPEGFEYVGDSRADLKVWVKAKAASLVGGGDARARAVEQMGVTDRPPLRPPHPRRRRLDQGAAPAPVGQERADLRARHHGDADQPIRRRSLTLLIALPAARRVGVGHIHSQRPRRPQADRSHPTKTGAAVRVRTTEDMAGICRRAGADHRRACRGAAAVTILCRDDGVLSVTTLAYSLRLKRVALADTLTLELPLHAAPRDGRRAGGRGASHWLMVFSMFLFVSLSLVLRRVAEARRAGLRR